MFKFVFLLIYCLHWYYVHVIHGTIPQRKTHKQVDDIQRGSFGRQVSSPKQKAPTSVFFVGVYHSQTTCKGENTCSMGRKGGAIRSTGWIEHRCVLRPSFSLGSYCRLTLCKGRTSLYGNSMYENCPSEDDTSLQKWWKWMGTLSSWLGSGNKQKCLLSKFTFVLGVCLWHGLIHGLAPTLSLSTFLFKDAAQHMCLAALNFVADFCGSCWVTSYFMVFQP